ncbi:hypothetical protein [Streptomyces sp. NBC_00035]|uniref:hypothetical protein n=1 Tax=Streptomyces sp. NBC_00035 TaxID=2903614 RepID=UPI00324FC742
MYAKLSPRDQRAVDAWQDLGNDLLTSLLNSNALRADSPRRIPADDLADFARRSVGTDKDLVRQETAEHEAAHAVVCRALGVPVFEVWIDENGRGETVHAKTLREANAAIAIAPQVWINEFRAPVFPAGARHIGGDNRNLMRSTGGDEHNVATARRRARGILTEHRDEVLQLARQLIRDGRVVFDGLAGT